MTDSIIRHLLENKKHTANHRNSKKTTTFVFSKRSVTSMRKYPIIQHVVSDSGHSTKGLKRGGTTRICKAVKYNDLHLPLHSVYLSKQRLYRLKWTVTDNQWCKYAASELENELKMCGTAHISKVLKIRDMKLWVLSILIVSTIFVPIKRLKRFLSIVSMCCVDIQGSEYIHIEKQETDSKQ